MLIQQGVEAIVHCGDHGSVECIHALGQCDCPVYAVAGNVDRDLDEITDAAEESDIHFDPRAVEIPLGDGNRMVATHGHLEDLLHDFVESDRFVFVCHGHTHKQRNQTVGNTLVVCPGSLHKPKGPKTPSCAMIDSVSREVRFLEVQN
jgi:hypothetical protein